MPIGVLLWVLSSYKKSQSCKTKLKTKRNEKAPSGALIPLNLKKIDYGIYRDD